MQEQMDMHFNQDSADVPEAGNGNNIDAAASPGAPDAGADLNASAGSCLSSGHACEDGVAQQRPRTQKQHRQPAGSQTAHATSDPKVKPKLHQKEPAGLDLDDLYAKLCSGALGGSAVFAPGARVWVRNVGSCYWPGVVFRISDCLRCEVAQVLASYAPGRLLVHHYGDHSHVWAGEGSLLSMDPADCETRVRSMQEWSRKHSKAEVARSALKELEGAHAGGELELARVCGLRNAMLEAQPRYMRTAQCVVCQERGAKVICRRCSSCYHSLCLEYCHVVPTATQMGLKWACPPCRLECTEALPSAMEVDPVDVQKAGSHSSMQGTDGTSDSSGHDEALIAAPEAAAGGNAKGGAGSKRAPRKRQKASHDVPVPEQPAPPQEQPPPLQEQPLAVEQAPPSPEPATAANPEGISVPASLPGLDVDALHAKLCSGELGGSAVFAPGAKVWVKYPGPGSFYWPAVVFRVQDCLRCEAAEVLASYTPGRMLVHHYGDHSHSWVTEGCLSSLPCPEEAVHLRSMHEWCRRHARAAMGRAAQAELEGVMADGEAELARVQGLRDTKLAAEPRYTRTAQCVLCQERGAKVVCRRCFRCYHSLCIEPPSVAPTQQQRSHRWACPECSTAILEQSEAQAAGHVPASAGSHKVRRLLGPAGGVPGGEGAEGGPEGWQHPEQDAERSGLTPDWIIHAAAYNVFQLQAPTAEAPYIKGLLDPCTNSKACPNIPAEVLYDEQDDGLRSANSWGGYHIILNPPYTSQAQWRFVNRAIDCVEQGHVPAVLLVSRNSTDTAYFQRLRPYPRVNLRRSSARFKDYDKTPIGFGVVVFCIAPPSARDLYLRFFDAFAAYGEPNLPIDRAFLESEACGQLLVRLQDHTQQHHRDHWVQCSACSKWRLITFAAFAELQPDQEWTCKQLSPPYSNCRTAQTRNEAEFSYAHVPAAGAAAAGQPAEGKAAGQQVAEQNAADSPSVAEGTGAGGSDGAAASSHGDATAPGRAVEYAHCG